MKNQKALVLFSGGQDSTVCLAWALARFATWRRSASITASAMRPNWRRVRACWRAAARISRIGPAGWATIICCRSIALKAIGGSALTDDIAIEMGADGLPTTFVPGRNILFLTAAAALGYRRGIADLVGGMCETDFSGYPDCRDETIKATAKALSLGLAREYASTRR